MAESQPKPNLLRIRFERILFVRPIWLLNLWLARLHWFFTSGKKRDPHFLKNRFVQGQFPQDKIERFMSLLAATPTYDRYAPNPSPDYLYDETKGIRDKDYNRGRYFFTLGESHLERVRDLLVPIADRIESAAGYRFRIVNVFCSRESETEKPEGEREWHHDRFADGAFKILVYLTGAGPEIGATEVSPRGGENFLVTGPPGMWMFFDNNALLHRAIVAKRGSRHLLQITIAPAFRTRIEPVHVPDAQYPKLPWKPAPSPLNPQHAEAGAVR